MAEAPWDKLDRLMKEGNEENIMKGMYEIIGEGEKQAKKDKLGVAPAYYERLAIIYRKRKDYKSEVEILERFNKQLHA